MRKLSRKLVIACLAVAFAVIALGTSTYAWLVVSKTASVDSFSAEVKAGDGSLQVSMTKDGTYGPSISSSELTQYTNGVKFKDLTLNENDNKFYSISVNTSSKTASLVAAGTAEELKENSIVQFEFYVKLDSTAADGASKDLKLDLFKTTIAPSSDSYSWTPEYNVDASHEEYKLTKGTPTTKYLASNAARIMVSLEGGNTVIVENSTNTGLQSASDTEGAMGYLKITLKGAITSDSIGVDSTNSKTSTNILGSGTASLGTVTTEAKKITVTVWLEGFDFDCINALYKQSLAATLGLTVAE